LGILGEECFKNIFSVWEGEVLIEFQEGIYCKRFERCIVLNLEHLGYGIRGDFEKDVIILGHNFPLTGNIAELAP